MADGAFIGVDDRGIDGPSALSVGIDGVLAVEMLAFAMSSLFWVVRCV
jgi:hypothetical protein